MSRWSSFLAASVLAFAVVGGCAPTTVRPIAAPRNGESLPKPDRIVVYDFAVSTNDVRLNSGPGARLLRRISQDPHSEEQAKVGRSVAAVFSEELVKAINQHGLPAERGPHLARLPERTLAIDGQFASIDEGNRARRVIIGFGAGGTEITAHVQVYMGTPAGAPLVREFEAKAESSKKPGAAVTMGAGAAIGAGAAVTGAAGGVLETQASVEADARRAAKELAKQLNEFLPESGLDRREVAAAWRLWQSSIETLRDTAPPVLAFVFLPTSDIARPIRAP